MQNPPKIGQTFTVYGQPCKIVRVYPFGTMDVISPTGKAYRVTGLPWLKVK